MGDLSKIDQHTQFKLTNTIQKAATLALASDKDPNQVLADQLKKADIPKQLTKVAAHAFNRRLSVSKLASCNDDTKAQDFSLADVQKVQQLRGLVKIKKEASLNSAPFQFKIYKPTMEKAASTQKAKEQPELTIEQGLKKLQKFIDEGTIKINDLRYALQSQQLSLQNLKKKASAYLVNDKKLSRQLATHYGDAYNKIFSQLPQQHLTKYASYNIIKKSAATELVQKAVNLYDSIQVKQLTLDNMAKQLDTFCKKASAIQQQVHQKRVAGLVKLADGWTFGKQIFANTVLNPHIAAANAAKDSAAFTLGVGSNLHDLASTRIAVSPQSVLTAQLLADDKYRDAAQVLTAVLSHPSTKNYGTRQIQRAVNDTLVAYPQFRSPRFGQHLLAAVKQRLSKGGQQNLAGLAAGQQLVKAIAQTDQVQKKNRPSESVKQLADVKSQKSLDQIKKRLLALKSKDISYIADKTDPVAAFVAGLKQSIVQPVLDNSKQYTDSRLALKLVDAANAAEAQETQQKYSDAIANYYKQSLARSGYAKLPRGTKFDDIRDDNKRQQIVSRVAGLLANIPQGQRQDWAKQHGIKIPAKA